MAIDEDESAHREALAWFGLEPGPGEWINQTWIARNGDAEMRLVDLVTGPGQHTLLLGMKPGDEPVMRWDDLDFETLHQVVDEVKALPTAAAFPLWDFSGPATTIPDGNLETTA
jgi:hypothetical protein